MKQRVILTLLLLLTFFAAQAFPQENKKEIKHFIGADYSSISGAGISYGYRFLPDFMCRINGIYVETNEKETTVSGDGYYITTVDWNTGVELQRNVFSFQAGNILITGYGLLGGSYWFSEYDDPEYPEEYDRSRRWVAGGALGVRILFYDHISINLEFGYQYGRDFDDNERYAGMAGGAGAHFAF